MANATAEGSPVMHQIGVLNLRINDMMIQLNMVMKALLEENESLKRENAAVKGTLQDKP